MKIVKRYCAEAFNGPRGSARSMARARQRACEGWIDSIKNSLSSIGKMAKDLFSSGAKNTEEKKESIDEKIDRLLKEIGPRSVDFKDCTVITSGSTVGLTVQQISHDADVATALATNAEKLISTYKQLLTQLDKAFTKNVKSPAIIVTAKEQFNVKARSAILDFLKPLQVLNKGEHVTTFGTATNHFIFIADNYGGYIEDEPTDEDDSGLMYLPSCVSKSSGSKEMKFSASELKALYLKALELADAFKRIDDIVYEYKWPDFPNMEYLWYNKDEPEDELLNALYWHAGHVISDIEDGAIYDGIWDVSIQITQYLLSILNTLEQALAQVENSPAD